MRNIFFDFDGTLIDSRKRLFSLFKHLVPEANLSFDDYWNLKRNKISHQQILTQHYNYTDEKFSLFNKIWHSKIELPEWLKLDEPITGTDDLLRKLQLQFKLYLLTNRQSVDMVNWQLKNYGWENVFDKVFVTGQKTNKFDLVNNSVIRRSDDWLVGDTGKDIEVGKQLGIKTAAVLTGFLNHEKLREYQPDCIHNSVVDIQF